MFSPDAPDARRNYSAWLAPLLIAASAIIHLSALRWWWLWDDPQLILHAIRVPAWQTLFDPEAYRTLAAHTFTPLLPISFKVDFILAGSSPAFAYGHQIVVIVVAALLLDQLLRRYVDRWVSIFSAATFAWSWMAVYATHTLMIRHYAEGLVAALAALIIWSDRRADGGVIRQSPSLHAGATVLWFLALLSKEIYAALPLLLMLQRRANGDSFREVVRALIGPAVATVIWLSWRWLMLGSVGGYGSELRAADLLTLPWRAVQALAGPEGRWAGWALIVATIVLATVSMIRSRRSIAVAAGFMIVALLPIVSLAGNFEWRFAFGVAALLVAGFALALDAAPLRVDRQRWIAAGMMLLTITAAPFAARAYRAVSEPVEMEGRYIWGADTEQLMLRADAPGWYLGGVRDLRHLLRAEASPRFVVSDEAFVSGDADPNAFVRWSPDSRTFERLDPGVYAALRAQERHLREPLAIMLRRDGELVAWSFDGPEGSSWEIVSLPEFAVWPVPAKGERRVPANADPGFFYVRMTRPDGTWRTTYEQAFPLDGDVVRWSSN